MNGLAFTAAIVSAIVWPCVVLVAALILREPLKQLLPLLVRLKYKDFELDFRRRLDDVAERIPVDTADQESELQQSLMPT